ncbi:hypothetical protein FGO68_gene10143 [Halteria grandinella]|uniref:Acyltransferase 3 domain-containing protein n=1 Tax=Halteria grandinella TaxID=5974 RepID=A0A8J8P2C7_HALGN|nr:hypothetical protein FGO68_gene10143 [Halteria grandinella]
MDKHCDQILFDINSVRTHSLICLLIYSLAETFQFGYQYCKFMKGSEVLLCYSVLLINIISLLQQRLFIIRLMINQRNLNIILLLVSAIVLPIQNTTALSPQIGSDLQKLGLNSTIQELKSLFSAQTQKHRHIKDPRLVSRLEERYPQYLTKVSQGDSFGPCVKNYAWQLYNLTQYPYDVMTMYGFMMINDLGSYSECQKLEMAEYAMVTVNITHVPLMIYFGTCLPKQCTQTDLQRGGDALAGAFNEIYSLFAPKVDGTGTFHPWTRFNFTVRRQQEMQDQWLENTQAGFTLSMFIFIPMLLLLFFVPTAYHIYIKSTRQISLQAKADLQAQDFKEQHSGYLGPNDLSMVSASPNYKHEQKSQDSPPKELSFDLSNGNQTRATDTISPTNNIAAAEILQGKGYQNGIGITIPGVDTGNNAYNPLRKQSYNQRNQKFNRLNESSEISTLMLENSLLIHQNHRNTHISSGGVQLETSQEVESFSRPYSGHPGSPNQDLSRAEGSLKDQLSYALKQLSVVSAFKNLRSTRCQPWDNRELDLVDGFKFITLILIQISATATMIAPSARATPWAALDMKPGLFFTVIQSCAMATDAFFALSAFMGTYKCIQIYEANGGKLTFEDVGKMFARKYMRIAPVLYLVFLVGWSSVARLETGPNWTNAQSLFLDCDKYWWAQILFIGNLVPYFSESNGGCFYWGWTFFIDMQLYLLVPVFVIVYKRAPRIGILLQFFLIFADAVFLMYMTSEYMFRASVLNVEGYYFFSVLGNKPYCKFVTYCVGVLAAFAYMELLAYRRIPGQLEKSEKHPILHVLHRANWIGQIFTLASLALLVYTFTTQWQSNIAPYKVNHIYDILYIGLNRTLFAVGVMALLLIQFMGYFRLMKDMLVNDYGRSLGKLAFPVGLVTPVVVTMMLCSQANSIYLTPKTSQNFACGHIFSDIFTGLALFLAVEYPLMAVLNMTVGRTINTHRNLLRRHYLGGKEEDKEKQAIMKGV